MKPRTRSVVTLLPSVCFISCLSFLPAVAVTEITQELDADNIAARSLIVAETMKSSGYCYSGVSKALSPLGVALTGAAAYQARDQLAADARFMPVPVEESVELRRGDILVFDKSVSHPYGHISVYQGNGQESSDHVSRLTTPGAYGGVSIFRLCSARYDIASAGDRFNWTSPMPHLAPDFRGAVPSAEYPGTSLACATPMYFPASNPKRYPNGGTKSATTANGDKGFFKRQFRLLSNSSSGKSLTKNLIRFVVQSL